MPQSILKLVEAHVTKLFEQQSPSQNVYHDIEHTRRVVQVSSEIGIASGLSEDEIAIVQIAAWFHDVGYFETIAGHEEKSAIAAAAFLSKYNFPQEYISKVRDCILATKVPQQPKTKLEKIICDADLHHLGTDIFFDLNEKYIAERENLEELSQSEQNWIENSIKFLSEHQFHTQYAKKIYSDRKNKNIEILHNQLSKRSD